MTERDCPGWIRLVREFYESWKIVQREKPAVCFTMNPSIFSSWWLSLLKGVYKFRLVTDLHTPNIRLSGFKKKMFEVFFHSGIKRSDIVIVTNEIFRNSILSLNPNIVVIPDPLPELSMPLNGNKHLAGTDGKIRILLVSSFGEDEPIKEVLAIDDELDQFDIMVTGNWRKKFASLPDLRNIHFLGFIPGDEYDQLLLSVDGVMVLTKEEGCLCCGAYEAFAAGKPVILSRTEAMQGYFGCAPIYTDNNSASILSALKTLRAEEAKRSEMIEHEKRILDEKFKMDMKNLEETLVEFGINMRMSF
ncbi:MAG: hypothetical protein HZA16_15655 [Nitrospirae bacterium]|nr:hypothetical protein [Nitrospirota bacterium]